MSQTLDERAPTLGEMVRALREERGYSARTLSLAAGLSESYVGKVEKGLEPSLRAFGKIALALRLTAREVHVLVTHEASRP